MAILSHLPQKMIRLANHLLTEQSGVAALDAVQGTVLSKRIQTVETVHIRDKSYNNDQVVDMLHIYWNELKNGCYTVTLETGVHTWRANIYKHSNAYGDYMISSYSNVYQAPIVGKIFNGTWTDYGEVALKSDSIYNQYTLTIEGDDNIYYPVVFPFVNERSNQLEIMKYVHDPIEWSGILRAKFEYGTSGWGGYMNFRKTHYCLWNKNLIANAVLGTGAVSNFIVWLKGGGIPYKITDNVNKGKGMIYYERTNLSYHVDYPYYIEPRTTIETAYQTQIQP